MKRARGARLGQHFLTGTWAASKLVEAARIRSTDTILEIGPGTGALTRELLKTGARVVAIEKDEKLYETLQSVFSSEIARGALTVVSGDVRDLDFESTNLGEYVLAANIPYYITGEIIRQFLTAERQPRTMVLLIQKEVAERIVARDKKESILSISVKAYGEPEIVAKVAKGNFAPPPSVDSAIIAIRNISKHRFVDVTEDLFFSVVRSGFASKRKFLASNLAKTFGKVAAMTAVKSASLPEKIRAEDVPFEKWSELAKAFAI